jgi:DNA polymerase-3 subunit alpha
MTKDHKEMAFLTIGDLTGNLECVVFPDVFEKYKNFLDGKDVVVVSGRLDGGKVLAEKIMSPEEFKKETGSQMHVLIKNSTDYEKLIKLRDIFIQNKGKCSIYIHVPELERNKKAIKASTFLLVDPKEALISLLNKEEVVERVWVS